MSEPALKNAAPIPPTTIHALDPLAVRDFCDFLGYSETEFWEIIDKLYNPDLFENNKLGRWVLKK